MSFIKSTMLLILCLSVFASSLANTSLQCCMDDQEAPIEMQMADGEPCHDTEEHNIAECDSCSCQHCVNIANIQILQLGKSFTASTNNILTTDSFKSIKLEILKRPPILIS